MKQAITEEQVVAFLNAAARFSPEQVAKLLAASRRSILSLLAGCEEALQAEQYAELKKVAHTLKGTLLQCGLFPWAEKAQLMSGGAEAGNKEGLRALLRELQQVLEPFARNAAPEADQGKIPPQDPAPEAPAWQRAVLVMDDEEVIRDVAQGMFEYLNYDCDLAVNGEEGIALYSRAMEGGKPYSLVIADVQVKGGMGGRDMAAAIVKLDPAAKIIVTSGDGNDPAIQKYGEYGFSGALVKPYSIKALSTLLQEKLGVLS